MANKLAGRPIHWPLARFHAEEEAWGDYIVFPLENSLPALSQAANADEKLSVTRVAGRDRVGAAAVGPDPAQSCDVETVSAERVAY